MSKEESTSSSRGLLHKVARFVRNPTVNWSDLDAMEEERESQYSRQMLKEMIERKRRNDFVRRREFDHLRKLRSREGVRGPATEDPGVRTSFFNTSAASADERADTLRKIDEIEQQMAQQWWKGKGSGAPAPARRAEAPPAPAPEPPPPAAPQPSPVASAMAAALADSPFAASEHARAFAPTAPIDLAAPVPPVVPPAPVPQPAPAALAPTAAGAPPTAAAAAQEAPLPFVHDPELEEAAIRFVNADYDGAEAALKELLGQQQAGASEELWHTLFDLYRAIGRQEPFDALAIDYAARFGRSAPLWFSLPQQLGLQVFDAGAAAAPAAPQREFTWNAPPALTTQSLAALQAALARAAQPWTLTWGRLASIDSAAVPGLAACFEQWAGQEVELRFAGMPALMGLLQAQTPSGERSRDPQWWRLRMAALRLMGAADEFELVALDYCVTYEVSPPSWEPPRCSFSSDSGEPALPSAPESDFGSIQSGFAISQIGGVEEEPLPALVGHIEGDASEALAQLEGMAPRPGLPLVIACEQLIRTDFAAGGGVLNWAAAQQAKGRELRFVRLHRLMAVFFNVIGINEHALVVPRQD